MPNPSGVPVDDDDDDSSLSALDSREEIASVNYVDEQTKPAAPKTEEKKEAVKESEPPKAPPKKSPSNVPPSKVPTKAPKKPPPMPETNRRSTAPVRNCCIHTRAPPTDLGYLL